MRDSRTAAWAIAHRPEVDGTRRATRVMRRAQTTLRVRALSRAGQDRYCVPRIPPPVWHHKRLVIGHHGRRLDHPSDRGGAGGCQPATDGGGNGAIGIPRRQAAAARTTLLRTGWG
jgi:hypothetical protein